MKRLKELLKKIKEAGDLTKAKVGMKVKFVNGKEKGKVAIIKKVFLPGKGTPKIGFDVKVAGGPLLYIDDPTQVKLI